ncbi:MAG: phosphatidylglycerol:prolipoprotein diacylglycerol transferase [Bradymonadia bacterium]|jgi:phosphatidylglycerol:prolipoprotein diacylglycerol transferase
MIPYFHFGPIEIGPIEIHVFGLLVGIGVLLGSWIAQQRAEAVGLHPRVVADLALWIILCSFFFAHQVSLFAYFPERVFGEACEVSQCFIAGEQFVCGANGRCDNGSWLEVLKIWSGISSYGGFLGAAIAFITFFRFKRLRIIPGFLDLTGGKNRPLLKYLDAMTMGFSVGWFFGRLGCFTAHDHIGKASDFFLAVNFPDGFRSSVPAIAEFGATGFTPRFDLGFLELFYCIALIALFFGWARKQDGLRPGWYASVMIMAYAPYRFLLDGLRATDIGGADKRYFADIVAPGVTPGQIGSLLILGLGAYLWILGGKKLKDPEYMAWFDGEDAAE